VAAVLALNVCAYVAEEVVQYRYGTAGALAVALIGIGHRAKNTVCTALGLVALALLLAR
jgi:uncharacterized membrane protein YesL